MWYGVTIDEIEQLEQIDEMWVRDLMECSSSVPKDLLYLEMGITRYDSSYKPEDYYIYIIYSNRKKRIPFIQIFYGTTDRTNSQRLG